LPMPYAADAWHHSYGARRAIATVHPRTAHRL